MPSNTIAFSFRTLSFVFAFIKQSFDSYVEYRQLRRNRSSEFPAHLQGFADPQTFSKSQSYNKDKRLFQLLSDWVNFFLNLWIVVAIDPALWVWAVNTTKSSNSVIYTTSLFLICSNSLSTGVALPWRLYKDFVVEERHGFNKKTVPLFASDLIKGEAITALVTVMLVGVLEKIRVIAGPNFHIYLWVTVQILVFVFMYVYPAVIQPLFNKFSPLKDETLKTAIDDLAKQHKFPLTQVFEVDGSKRSSHSNAYFYGFGSNKRIVLFDTLLTLERGEILAVLCHEMGHWFHGHLLKNLAVVSAHMFVLFYCFKVFAVEFGGKLVSDFAVGAFNGTPAFVVTLLLFTKMYAPVEAVLEFFMVAASRKFEFQADAFAVQAGRGRELADALKKIQKDNLGEMDPDWLYSAVKYTHPPVFERIAAIESGEFVVVDDKKTQ